MALRYWHGALVALVVAAGTARSQPDDTGYAPGPFQATLPMNPTKPELPEGPAVRESAGSAPEYVRAIDISGNEFASTGHLKTQLMSELLCSKWFDVPYSPLRTQAARIKLREFYRGFGFYGVRVTSRLVTGADPSQFTIVFHIKEGTRYSFNLGEQESIDHDEETPP